MTRLVVLLPAEDGGAASNYDVRVGPLAFVTPADHVSESIGDGLDVVGSSIVASERRPRPLKLKLPVRGYHREIDPKEAGLRLKRQVRQALDNARLRLWGFFFMWSVDPDLDCWLMIGGGELSESDPGISFGEYDLELSDVYIVGRPGTHRPARRAAILDRRGGVHARDTRQLLYSLDFASQELPAEPIVLPGDSVDLVSTGNRPVASTSLGPERVGARHLWRTAAGMDAEVISYRPDSLLLPDRKRYLDLDSLGSVRVWDLSNATPYPPLPAGYATARDESPELYYGWEQVFGDVLTPDKPLAMDNGVCRVLWLGNTGDKGLAIEYWDAGVEHFVRLGRVLHSLNVAEQRVVECTPERSVLEWRAGRYGMRAILQRGWWGPRLESYDDGGESTRLEFAPETGSSSVTTAAATPTWVRKIKRTSGEILLWAQGSADETIGTSPTVLSGVAATFARTRVLVAQLGCPGGPSSEELASLSLIDARAIPSLVGRE